MWCHHSLDISHSAWVLSYAACVKLQPKELHVGLLDFTFPDVENESMLSCHFHQVVQMFVVIGLCSAEHTNVVSDADSSLTLFEDTVHPLLEDILTEVQAKR